MDKIDKILKYIRRTNPEMTRKKLIEELGQSSIAWMHTLAIIRSFSQKMLLA